MDNQPAVTFQVSPNSGEPIFRQLIEQVKRYVACGQLKSGHTLPSVRSLGRALSVNPMTVSKAYSHLEMEGVVARKAGVGMLITSSGADDEAARLALLQPVLDELLLQAEQLDVSVGQLVSAVKARARHHNEEKTS